MGTLANSEDPNEIYHEMCHFIKLYTFYILYIYSEKQLKDIKIILTI